MYLDPIMKQHHLSVTSLEEFPPNREFVGRNFNAGEVIQLVLKSPSSGRWLPFRYVQMVMMHELAHCQQMNHSRAFWAVRNGFAAEMQDLWRKSYTGEGIWGRGAQLGTGEWEQNTITQGETLPEHLCGGTYRSRRKRKAPKLSYQEQKQRRIDKKFGKNGVTLGSDDDVKVKLEGGKKKAGKPRVAGSARGRDLRAAAALARFQQIKAEEDTDIKDEIKDEDETASEDDEPDALDWNGLRLVDAQGRGMVKVCEDEDGNDPAVKQEMDELFDVFQIDDVARPAAASTTATATPASANHVKSEAIRDRTSLSTTSAAAVAPKPNPKALPRPHKATTAISMQDIPPWPGTDNPLCALCSFKNEKHSPTCAVCAHVLNPDSVPGSWKCKGSTCKNSLYVNSGDSAVCGVCGLRKGG